MNIEAALLPRTHRRRPEKLLRFSPISCLSTYVKPWDFFFSPFNGGIVFSQNLDPFLHKKLFLQLREWNSIWGLQVIFEGNYFLRKWRGVLRP